MNVFAGQTWLCGQWVIVRSGACFSAAISNTITGAKAAAPITKALRIRIVANVSKQGGTPQTSRGNNEIHITRPTVPTVRAGRPGLESVYYMRLPGGNVL